MAKRARESATADMAVLEGDKRSIGGKVVDKDERGDALKDKPNYACVPEISDRRCTCSGILCGEQPVSSIQCADHNFYYTPYPDPCEPVPEQGSRLLGCR